MKCFLAELIGTFVLVFGGVGAAVFAGDKIGYMGVALAFGLSLLAMAYTVGPISGCHINPAVTLGMLICGKIKQSDAAVYVVAQVLGAVIASGLVLLLVSGLPQGYDVTTSGLAANGFGAHSPGGYSLLACFLAEVILTAFLVLTVLGSTDTRAPVGFAGIPIGLVLVLIHLVGIPITNTSVNPARSIGPALFVGGWALQQLWLFMLAPLLGAVVAAIAYKSIRVSRAVISGAVAEQALTSEEAERQRLRRPEVYSH